MERLSRGNEQRPLLNNSAVILQNPIDEQGATSVESLWKGATNHERLRTIGLYIYTLWFAHHLHYFYTFTCRGER